MTPSTPHPPTPIPVSVATVVAAFTIGVDGSLSLRGVGKVPGYLLSQWAMDEHAGHLRVAYTRTDGSTTENAVDVLDAASLVRVGRLGGLGRGERIYSVRFAGAVGYMVTFRQVDPLYTLDLSDPAAPAVHGELKIPGYSDYLHPIDSGTLLGVGRAGNEAGALTGAEACALQRERSLLAAADGVRRVGRVG